MASREATALLHAKTSGHQKRLQRTREIIRRAFGVTLDWYCSFSGGKDSTCVLSLVREYRPETLAITAALQWHFPETAELLDRTPNLYRVALAKQNTPWASHWDEEAEIPDGVEWLGDDPHKAMKRNFGRRESAFLGLRKAESRARNVLLNSRGDLFLSKKTGAYYCNPIAQWSTVDVWAYIHHNRIPYNQAYDVMERIGVPLELQRVGPFAIDRVLRAGPLAILKRGWPGLFNAYAARHPEARLYA